MKLDRNENPDGVGKYALINMRRVRSLTGIQAAMASDLLTKLDVLGVIDKGVRGADDEFFVIKLKDK